MCFKLNFVLHIQGTIPFTFQDGGKLNAEIRWVLKHVVSGYSDNSVKDSVNVFKAMFLDSKISSFFFLIGIHSLQG